MKKAEPHEPSQVMKISLLWQCDTLGATDKKKKMKEKSA